MSSTTLITDSHCHFDFPVFDTHRDQAMQRARELGIGIIIVPGVEAGNWPKVEQVCERYNECYPAYGLHPYFIDQHTEQDLHTLEQWLTEKKPVAVGECGLDFYLKDLDKSKQLHFFEAQLTLADEHDLPVIIHARKSTEQVIQIVKQLSGLRGMIHSYSGSYEQARQLMDSGFYFSFGGAMTYNRATRLRDMIKRIPLQHVLLETDAPDQPGSRHQGETNEPAYIDEVIDNMATLYARERSEIIQQTTANARQLFGIHK